MIRGTMITIGVFLRPSTSFPPLLLHPTFPITFSQSIAKFPIPIYFSPLANIKRLKAF